MRLQKNTRSLSGKKTIIAIIVLAMVSYAAVLIAYPMQGRDDFEYGHKGPEFESRHGKKAGPQSPILHLLYSLDLTDAQSEKIIDYSTSSRKTIIQIKSDIQILQIDKKTAIMNEDWKETKKLIDKITEKRADIQKNHIELKEDISNVLTDEQKDELKEKIMYDNNWMQEKNPRKLDKKWYHK